MGSTAINIVYNFLNGFPVQADAMSKTIYAKYKMYCKTNYNVLCSFQFFLLVTEESLK